MSGRDVENTLARTLRDLADAERRVDTPAHVEAAIMAAWDAAHATRPPHRTRNFVRGAATMAAGVTIIGAVALDRELSRTSIALPKPPVISLPAPPTRVSIADAGSEPSRESRDRVARPALKDEGSTIVLIGGPIATGEIVHVVRMRVDRAALIELGITATTSNEDVDVDVFVGEDGVARGVRVSL